MTQGQRVIEIAANHPATAQFMCTKICARFFGENPPSAVVDAAVETWMANQDANDQIAQVVRTILLTNELRQGPQTKFRRPFEQAIAYKRAVNARVTPNWLTQWSMQDTLDGLWTWVDPNGRPENNEFWTTSSILRHMWWYLDCIIGCGAARVTLADELPLGAEDSIGDILEFYYERFYGFEPSLEVHNALVDDAFDWAGVMNGPMDNAEDREWRLRRLTVLIAAANEFVHR